MKNKIFLPGILTLGILASACGDDSGQQIELAAAQRAAAMRAQGAGGSNNTVTVTQQTVVTQTQSSTEVSPISDSSRE